MRKISMVVAVLVLGACSNPTPAPVDAFVAGNDANAAGNDANAATCSGITGNYTAAGTIVIGSTCDASLQTLSGAVAVSGDATAGYTTTLTVGGIAYSCTGVVTGCRWDATCTGTATDGSMVRGMLMFNFTNMGFSGTLSETFTGTTNCLNNFTVTATRS